MRQAGTDLFHFVWHKSIYIMDLRFVQLRFDLLFIIQYKICPKKLSFCTTMAYGDVFPKVNQL